MTLNAPIRICANAALLICCSWAEATQPQADSIDPRQMRYQRLDLEFESVPIAEAAERLSKVLQVKFVLDENVSKGAKVTFRGRNAVLRTALHEMLQPHGLTFEATPDAFHILADDPDYEAARQAAGQSPGWKQFMSIGLALHSYHDIHGHFPSAIVLGPDEETPHSWRVELLPLLDSAKSFRRAMSSAQPANSPHNRRMYYGLIEKYGYRLNEPWDSPNNRAVVRKIPDEYRHPSDPDSTNAAFFAVKGAGTVFVGREMTALEHITDGPRNTMMLVEARRDVPWTKPEDIEYLAAEPLPEFGGYLENAYLVLTADGAVHRIAASTPDANVRALITKDAQDKFSIPGVPYRFK